MKDIKIKKQFESFYLKHRTAVYCNALLYTKSKEAAEDVMQSVFLELLEKLKGNEDIPNLSGWVIRLTKYRALNYISSSKQSVPLNEKYSFTENLEGSAEKKLLIEQALSLLSDDELEIFNLKVLGGFRHREIANALDSNPSTVRWQYAQIVKKLKSVLSDLS